VDTVTCIASPQAEYMQQLQAEWPSAFCAFSDLTNHPDKIKATIVGKIYPMHELKMEPDGATLDAVSIRPPVEDH
jgi:hypothetical protein